MLTRRTDRDFTLLAANCSPSGACLTRAISPSWKAAGFGYRVDAPLWMKSSTLVDFAASFTGRTVVGHPPAPLSLAWEVHAHNFLRPCSLHAESRCWVPSASCHNSLIPSAPNLASQPHSHNHSESHIRPILLSPSPQADPSHGSSASSVIPPLGNTKHR